MRVRKAFYKTIDKELPILRCSSIAYTSNKRMRIVITGRWSVQECIPTLERGRMIAITMP